MAKPRHRRKLRNLLLDRRFQLKYAGYIVAVAGILSALLGGLIWRTSQSLVAQSRATVAQGHQVVALGDALAAESKKVSDVVKMNMAESYADSPELLALFKKDNAKQEAALKAKQSSLRDHETQLKAQAAKLETEQQTMFQVLVGVLGLLVVAVGLMGIVVTHKVAGPVFKMSRQLERLGDGNWEVPAPLRQGDELEDFFATFRGTVIKLRERRAADLELLQEALESVEEDSPAHAKLTALAESLETS